MRTIAEGLIFREATAAELRILDRARHLAISVDKVNCSRNANGSAFWVYKDLDVI